MPSGGILTIRTADIALGHGYVKASPDAVEGDYVMLSISDTSGYTDVAVSLTGVIDPGIAFRVKPYTITALALKSRDLLDGSRGT